MRRGGPLNRKTPLNNRSELARTELARTALTRKTPLNPGRGLTRQPAQRKAPFRPQRPTVSPEERRARKLVRARSDGTCEVCGAAPATNFQHRLPKSGQGGWSASNGLDVCGHGNVLGCHAAIHQKPERSYRMGWSVRRGLDPAATPVWLAGDREWCLLSPDGSITPINDIPDSEAS